MSTAQVKCQAGNICILLFPGNLIPLSSQHHRRLSPKVLFDAQYYLDERYSHFFVFLPLGTTDQSALLSYSLPLASTTPHLSFSLLHPMCFTLLFLLFTGSFRGVCPGHCLTIFNPSRVTFAPISLFSILWLMFPDPHLSLIYFRLLSSTSLLGRPTATLSQSGFNGII